MIVLLVIILLVVLIMRRRRKNPRVSSSSSDASDEDLHPSFRDKRQSFHKNATYESTPGEAIVGKSNVANPIYEEKDETKDDDEFTRAAAYLTQEGGAHVAQGVHNPSFNQWEQEPEVWDRMTM